MSGAKKYSDKQLLNILQLEERRQLSQLSLVASENYTSPAIRAFEGSIFADKNAEGYPGKRYVAGCEYADELENLAIERAKSAFNCDHANVQAMSATIANFAIMNEFFARKDLFMSMRLQDGGHLSHGALFHASGQNYKWCFYGVSQKTELIDYDELKSIAQQNKPKAILCGGSSYPQLIDYEKVSEIAREINALLWVDMAHTAGLVAGGVVPSPFPYADIVTTSTHKTLRGPRGGAFILCNKTLAKKVDRAIFPGLQGAPKMDMIAARAALLGEVQTPLFRKYAQTVLSNAKALERGLIGSGVGLITGGTGSHLLLINLAKSNTNGYEIENLLMQASIVSNKNPIPFDNLPPSKSGGLRIGSAAITTRGFTERQCFELGGLIGELIGARQNQKKLSALKSFVNDSLRNLPLFHEKWLDT